MHRGQRKEDQLIRDLAIVESCPINLSLANFPLFSKDSPALIRRHARRQTANDNFPAFRVCFCHGWIWGKYDEGPSEIWTIALLIVSNAHQVHSRFLHARNRSESRRKRRFRNMDEKRCLRSRETGVSLSQLHLPHQRTLGTWTPGLWGSSAVGT